MKKVLVWIPRILVSLGFLAASIGKVTQNPQVLQMFSDWGFPSGFSLAIGIIELLGAILILIPKTSQYASYGLLVIMLGAAVTHIMHDSLSNVIRPLIFMALIGLNLYFLHKKNTANS